MTIYFGWAGLWVEAASLWQYARWVFRGHRGEGLKAMALYFREPYLRDLDAAASDLTARAVQCGVNPGWIRARTDGTRCQVFDRRGNIVAQLAISAAGEHGMRRDLWARKRAGDLAAAIVRRCPAQGGYAEQRLDGWIVPPSQSQLDEVLRQLQKNFYRVTQIPWERYRRRIAARGPLDELDRSALDAAGAQLSAMRVPASWIHGDLWAGNILRQSGGSYRLLDWEYARPSLVTADGWYYLYHWRRLEERDPGAFHASFGAMLERVWGMPAKQIARGLHLAHLVERRVFLRSLHVAQPHLVDIESDMREELAAASRTMAGSGR